MQGTTERMCDFPHHSHPHLAKKKDKHPSDTNEWNLVREDTNQSFQGKDGDQPQDAIDWHAQLCELIDGQSIQECGDKPISSSIYQDETWVTAAGEVCPFLETLSLLIQTDPHTSHHQLASNTQVVHFAIYYGSQAYLGTQRAEDTPLVSTPSFWEIAPSHSEMLKILERC